MKATELMIGDWVLSPNQCPMKWKFNGVFCAEECSPIPLTAEILEKNHFTNCKVVGTYSICVRNFDGWAYVHELQHALRLCRLTELADNFKID